MERFVFKDVDSLGEWCNRELCWSFFGHLRGGIECRGSAHTDRVRKLAESLLRPSHCIEDLHQEILDNVSEHWAIERHSSRRDASPDQTDVWFVAHKPSRAVWGVALEGGLGEERGACCVWPLNYEASTERLARLWDLDTALQQALTLELEEYPRPEYNADLVHSFDESIEEEVVPNGTAEQEQSNKLAETLLGCGSSAGALYEGKLPHMEQWRICIDDRGENEWHWGIEHKPSGAVWGLAYGPTNSRRKGSYAAPLTDIAVERGTAPLWDFATQLKTAIELDEVKRLHREASEALDVYRKAHPDLAGRIHPGTRAYELEKAERELSQKVASLEQRLSGCRTVEKHGAELSQHLKWAKERYEKVTEKVEKYRAAHPELMRSPRPFTEAYKLLLSQAALAREMERLQAEMVLLKMTVHKSQGATVDRCSVLASRAFESHATYVATSRRQQAQRQTREPKREICFGR